MIFLSYVWTKVMCLVFFLLQIQGFSLGLWPSLWLVWLLCLPWIYVWVYEQRSLETSLPSLVFFSANGCILWGFLLGFGRGLQGSLRLGDLAPWFFYRYPFLALLVGGSLVWFLYLTFYPPQESKEGFFSFLGQPWLLEETRRLILTWEPGPLGDRVIGLLEKFYDNPSFFFRARRAHFFVALVIPGLQTLLLLFTVFVLQDLRWNLLFLPLSLCSWLYAHVFYYLRNFSWDNQQVLDSYLEVDVLTDIPPEAREVDDFTVALALTPLGEAKGYSEKDFPRLHTLWMKIQGSEAFFFSVRQSPWVLGFPHFLSFLRLLAFLYLCSFLWVPLTEFFDQAVDQAVYSGLILSKVFQRSLATARWVDPTPEAQKLLAEVLPGVEGKNHFVAVEDSVSNPKNPREVQLLGQCSTHPRRNQGFVLLSHRNIRGAPVPQHILLAKNPSFFPKKYLGPEIKGSRRFFARPEVVEALGKNFPPKVGYAPRGKKNQATSTSFSPRAGRRKSLVYPRSRGPRLAQRKKAPSSPREPPEPSDTGSGDA